jgi:hypothetical protein
MNEVGLPDLPCSATIAKRSPPIPHEADSTTDAANAVATAASTAFPPFESARNPAAVARGWAEETIPRVENAGPTRRRGQRGLVKPATADASGKPIIKFSSSDVYGRPNGGADVIAGAS